MILFVSLWCVASVSVILAATYIIGSRYGLHCEVSSMCVRPSSVRIMIVIISVSQMVVSAALAKLFPSLVSSL